MVCWFSCGFGAQLYVITTFQTGPKKVQNKRKKDSTIITVLLLKMQKKMISTSEWGVKHLCAGKTTH